MNFYTADTHFGHKNVIESCGRPFSSVDEMDAEMIRRWNVVVGKDDTVFHIGDFAFCGAIRVAEILSQLNGQKILIRGNHDHWKEAKYQRLGFFEVYDLQVNPNFTMSHFPYLGEEIDERKFDKQLTDEGGWLLHGHVHNSWKVKKKMINVGVDQWSFAPVSYDEIMGLIE